MNTAAQHHIKDLVFFQIAEGGGIALATGEEVLIDAQDLWARGAGQFRCFSGKEVLEMPLHGGGADAFALAQTTAADPVPVPAEDHFAEGLGGVLAFEQPGKLLTKVSSANPALPFARLQYQFTLPKSPALVPNPALVASFTSQVRALALQARYFSRIPRGNAHLP